MKINDSDKHKASGNNLKNSFFGKPIFTKRTLILFLFAAIFIFGYVASNFIKKKGYTGLWDFTTTITSNYVKGLKANPENISIEIKEKDFKKLEKNRKQALERGVIINDLDGDYISATIEYKEKKIDVKLRLKGHMTDHLQKDKWSFRVKVKDKDSFMGMKRFSLQHPGTRGYIYEWIYHQLMKREGIIALRYKFINVTVNGRDWGIYCLEENFDKELIENNNRKAGPIIRFNPNLYWVDRLNELEGEKPVAEYASYYSANVEAYREDKVLEDSTQKQYYLKAIALMEGFRNRKLLADDVFDIEKLAKFHAVIDLVGGQHSIDWSDIKYYYNPVSAKLEPVAYESFTVFPFRDISGNYKYVIPDSNEYYEDLHTALFSDPEFFKAYISNLERISESTYLDEYFKDVEKELNENLAILYKEFPYKKFDKQGYYQNQVMIKKILNTPKAIHAYFTDFSKGIITLQIGAIESLPVEVKSISIGKSLILPSKKIILPAKQMNTYVNYKNYSFFLPKPENWNDSLISSIKINYSILGSSVVQSEKVFPFPHTDTEFISTDLKNKQSNIKEFSFLVVDENTKSIFFKSGKQIISNDLIIPKGYKVFGNSDVSIDFINHAKIISYSALFLTGTEDEPFSIESSDSTFQGIEIINAGKSIFSFVTFKNLPKIHDEQWARSAAITFYESPVDFKNCSFYNSRAEDAVNIIRSKFSFKECLFQKMNNDAIDIDFSEGTVTNCVFERCDENALDITMGKVSVNSIYINRAGNKGLNIKAGTQFTGNGVQIKNANIAISAEDLSSIDLKNVSISDSEIGLAAYKNKPGAGHPTINISGLVLTHVNKKYLKEKKSTIIVNGITISDEEQDVETIIKGDKKKRK